MQGCFVHGSIFDTTAFCLREKQGMLVNDECNSWYSRVSSFSYQFGIGESSFGMSMAQHAWPDRAILLQSAWLMTLNAMTVECE